MNSSESVPAYTSGTVVPPVISRIDLTFENPVDTPLLTVPPRLQHGGSGKYNYAVAQDKPFSFADVTQVGPEVTDFTVQVEPDDFLKELSEPDEGGFPPEFDGKKI